MWTCRDFPGSKVPLPVSVSLCCKKSWVGRKRNGRYARQVVGKEERLIQTGSLGERTAEGHDHSLKQFFLPHLILLYRAGPTAALVQAPGREACYLSSSGVVWKYLGVESEHNDPGKL